MSHATRGKARKQSRKAVSARRLLSICHGYCSTNTPFFKVFLCARAIVYSLFINFWCGGRRVPGTGGEKRAHGSGERGDFPRRSTVFLNRSSGFPLMTGAGGGDGRAFGRLRVVMRRAAVRTTETCGKSAVKTGGKKCRWMSGRPVVAPTQRGAGVNTECERGEGRGRGEARRWAAVR